MEASVPGTSLTTVSTEQDSGSVVDTGASRADRRSPRPSGRRTTGSSIGERRSTGSSLRVEGVSISAISRIEGLAWNTVARWLEWAAAVCRRFNHGKIAGFVVEELHADEIRGFVGGKTRPTWIFVAIEVWSPLAVDGDRKTKLPQHARSAARHREPHGSRASSLDRHRRIRFLGEGRRSSLWSRGSLRPGAQDAKTRSHRSGRTKRADGRIVAARRRAQQLRGLVDIEHVIH